MSNNPFVEFIDITPIALCDKVSGYAKHINSSLATHLQYFQYQTGWFNYDGPVEDMLCNVLDPDDPDDSGFREIEIDPEKFTRGTSPAGHSRYEFSIKTSDNRRVIGWLMPGRGNSWMFSMNYYRPGMKPPARLLEMVQDKTLAVTT